MNARTYSVAEAAEQLGVGSRWLADQARAGLVPCRRLGRRVRFTDHDVSEILAAAAHGQVQANPWGLTKRSRRKAS